ncbi:uncharacterized protein LODBEIA_P23690 [Lodderomyces beijingensis]|uniref:D-lactate dehydratase n=1 Tax=Lodderomyces beijingensis TaxID=1775926 RepID=A0ABP0ZPL0_9ASCO
MVKVLLAVTAYNEVFYQDGTKTGLFVSEALEPFLEFAASNYEVQFASETGRFGYDEHSTSEDFLSGNIRAAFEDKNSFFNQSIAKIKKASDLINEDFDIFFAAGGHGAIFDFPKAKSLHAIAAKTWEKGGIVSAVCHGPAIFENLNLSSGEPLIKGKKITGFTDVGEKDLGLDGIIEKDHLLTVAGVAKKEGAEYVSPKGPWDDFVVVDGNGRLITGVNPQSAEQTGKKTIDAYQSLKK